MAILTLDDVSLAFGHVPLLAHVALAVEVGERIGLIGRNGTGKSSMLRIIAGGASPDDGRVVRQSGLKWALLDQEPSFGTAATVFDAVASGLADGAQALIEYEHAAGAVASGAEDALDALAHAQAALEAAGGWTLMTRIETTLDRLQLDAHQPIATLSGGQQKRVALARMLVGEPDLLLLDEPTNHLDIDSIRWLERFLIGERRALLFVTHDRAFLDAVATRIIELDRGVLRSYPGSFAAYQARKVEELANERVESAKFDKLLAQEEAWIRKGVEARRTRNEGRVRRLEALRRERAVRRDQGGRARLTVDAGDRSGKLVAELVDVEKSFGARTIVRSFSATLMRGDKIGLIGPNGSGKTTLLKLILGELEPDSGTVRRGTNLQVAYFDQMRSQLDPERSVLDSISPGSDWVEIAGQRKHVMSYLGDFLFAPERARSPVKSLSGGERNRLLLARLFARPANVLVLDEPTNDLDIDTLELLEDLLIEYEGTVFLVSHDRAFLDSVITQCIVTTGDGTWREHVGGYSDWQRSVARAPDADAALPEPARGGGTSTPPKASKNRGKLSYKEQRELEALPRTIEALEAEQKSLVAALADPGIYEIARRDELKRLEVRSASLEQEMVQALTRWEDLEGRN